MTTPDRKIRCRVLDRLSNRCPNEALSDYGMCGKHLAGAAAEFRSLIAEAKAQLVAAGDGR